jgi:hypothetical protein
MKKVLDYLVVNKSEIFIVSVCRLQILLKNCPNAIHTYSQKFEVFNKAIIDKLIEFIQKISVAYRNFQTIFLRF